MKTKRRRLFGSVVFCVRTVSLGVAMATLVGCGSHEKTAVDAATRSQLRGIRNGDARFAKFLPQVVRIRGNNGSLCSGTMIGGSKVLTAAHCVRNLPGPTVDLFNGDNVLLMSSPVVRSYAYPYYNGGETAPDIGVMIIAHNIAAIPATRYIQPFLVPVQNGSLWNLAPQIGEALLVAGFGQDRDWGGQGIRRTAVLPITGSVNYHLPNGQYSGWGYRLGNNGNNAQVCPGDSGGPLLKQYGNTQVVFGVASQLTVRGGFACSYGVQSTFSSVAATAWWINGVN